MQFVFLTSVHTSKKRKNMTITGDNNVLSLETVRLVWAIELKDLDERLIGGNDPNSRLNKIEETYVDVQRKTGAEKSTQNMLLATIGNLTGATGLIMAGIAIVGGLDILDAQKVLRKAEVTEKLLELSKRPISSVNWDTLISLIDNIENWLVPILAKRIESLAEILQISSNTLAQERLETYLKAVEELEVALATLKDKAKEFSDRWFQELKVYEAESQNALEGHEAEKRQLVLENEALLINKAEFISKSREIKDKYTSLECAEFGCHRLATSNSAYCFYHKCFAPACSDHASEPSHYCEAHEDKFDSQGVNLPSLSADKKSSESDEKSSNNISKRKSPATAVFISTIVPGSGQIYSHRPIRGLGIFLSIPIALIFLPILIIPIWIWGMIDAASTVRNFNKSLPAENLTDETYIKGEVPAFSTGTLVNGQFSSFSDKPLSPIAKKFIIATALLLVAGVIKVALPAIIPFSPAKTSEELLYIFSHKYYANKGDFSLFVDEIRAKDDLPGFWKAFIKNKYGDNGITATINEKNNICGQIEQKFTAFKTSNGSKEVAKEIVDISDQCLAKVSDIGDYYELEKAYLKRKSSIAGKDDIQLKSTRKNIASNAAEYKTLSLANSKMHDAYNRMPDESGITRYSSVPNGASVEQIQQEYEQKNDAKLELLYGKENAAAAKRVWENVQRDSERKQDIIKDEQLRESVRRSYGQ